MPGDRLTSPEATKDVNDQTVKAVRSGWPSVVALELQHRVIDSMGRAKDGNRLSMCDGINHVLRRREYRLFRATRATPQRVRKCSQSLWIDGVVFHSAARADPHQSGSFQKSEVA